MKKNGNTSKLQLMAKELKRICKRKISITESFLVIFLITGGIAYSEPLTSPTENIVSEKQISEKLLTKKISISGTNKITDEIITLNYTSIIEESIESKSAFKSMNDSIMNEMANSKVNKIDEILKLSIDKTTTVDDLIKNFNIEYSDNLKLVDVDRKKSTVFGVMNIGKMALGAGALFYGAKEGFLSPEGAFKNSNKDSDNSVTPTPEPVIPPESIIVENEIRRDIAGTGEVYEFSKVYDVRENGIAISAKGENSKVINNGELIINNDTGIGIQAIGNNSTAENIKTITVNKGTGMYSNIATGKLINKNSGLVTVADGKGMWTENGATGINKSTISGTGAGTGVALYASKGGKVINDTDGTIDGNFNNSIVATGKNSEGINRGIIKNTGNYGMLSSDGGVVTNEDGAKILNSGIYGMGATGKNSEAINKSKLERAMKSTDGGRVINNKEIVTTHTYSMEADGKDSEAINDSAVALTKGMAASNGGKIINSKISSITSQGEKAMLAQGKNSIGVNEGIISNNGEYGMFAQNQGEVINEVDGIISNNGTFAMGASGENSIARNRGTLSKEMEAKLGATIINEGQLNHAGTYAMEVTDKDSTAINDSLFSLTKGMFASGGGHIINSTKSNIDFVGDKGMTAEGKDSSALNKGKISNSGDNAMFVENNAIATNEGEISNSGNNAMFAQSGAKIINNGVISNKNDSGMRVDGVESEAINKGTISNSGLYGMNASNSATATNDISGVISNENDFGMISEGTGSNAINKGTISNKGEYGMFALDGGKALNTDEGKITNSGIYGMGSKGVNSEAINQGKLERAMKATEGGKVINNKEIVTTHTYSMEADGKDSMAINDSITDLTKGMFASGGGLILNETKSNISFAGDKGMTAQDKDSVALNKGNISNTGNFGMFVENSAVATNEGEISNSGNNAMFAQSGAKIINNGVISNKNDSGMKVDGVGSEAINKGTISNSGLYGMNASNSATATNDISGVISNENDFGMISEGTGSNAINKGTISNKGEYGMFALDGGKALNTDEGKITNSGIYGMGAKGVNSEAINQGKLERAMKATEGGKVINNKEIVTTHTYSMEADDKDSMAINDSIIDLTKGMFASGGGLILNETKSNISFVGDKGMTAQDKDSVALNKGKISNTGNFGMFVENSAVATNEGEISNSGDNAMFAQSGAKIINNSTISNENNYGMSVDGVGSEAINNGTIQNKSNYGMNALNGGSITNNSTILTKGNMAMVATGVNSIANNNGTISNGGSFGMLAEGTGAIATNNGTISNKVHYGMAASDKGQVINNANKDITNTVLDFGMSADKNGSSAINYGTISNSGLYGMNASNSATATNEVSGVISNGKDFGMLSESTGSNAINKGIISNNGEYGMFASVGGKALNVDGAIITNNGIYGMGAKGDNSEAINQSKLERAMKATNGGKVINNKEVITNHTYSMEAEDKNSMAINDSIVGLTKGMFASGGGKIVNTKISSIVSPGEKAMFVDGINSVGINEGTISNNAEYGMFAQNKGEVLNEVDGIITNNGTFGMGATGEGAIARNKGTLSREMEATLGATIINEGKLTHTGTYAMQVNDKNSTAINNSLFDLTKGMFASGGGKIINTEISSIVSSNEKAMLVDGVGSVGINEGIISNNGEYGMFAQNQGEVINRVFGKITNNGTFGMGATGINSIARNKGTLTKEMEATLGATIINEGVLAHAGTYGMQVNDKDSTAINDSLSILDKGMFASGSGKIINTGLASIVTSKEKAMLVDGKDSLGVNLGIIFNDGEYGMFAQNNGEVINEVDALILNNGTFGMGATGNGSIARNKGVLAREMEATLGATIINEGKLDHVGTYGMQVNDKDSTAINDSLFDLTKGMFASGGGIIINETKSNISFSGDKGMSAQDKDSIAINKGKISNTGNYGMFASNGSNITNEATGLIINSGNYGMRAIDDKTTLLNLGTISNNGTEGLSITLKALGINEGIISNKGNYGMTARSAGSAINKGTISNTGTFGMFSDGGSGIILNDVTGKIQNTLDEGISIYDNASAINKGLVENGKNYGISAMRNSTATNEGIVSNNGTFGMYGSGGSTVINESTGIISNSGNYGMGTIDRKLDNGATIINKGIISNKGDYGIHIGGCYSSAINEVGGRIENSGDYGMASIWRYDGANPITNKGIISNRGNYGMHSDNSPIVNQGVISNGGNYGIYTTGSKGTAINNGTVSNDGETKVAAFDGAIAINEKTGVINVANDSGVGMEANGTGSRAVNKGTIKLTGNNQIAMYAKNNGSVTNDVDGIIDLSNATNGSSLKADTGGTIVNNGTVLLKNTPIKSDTTSNKAKRSIETTDSESLLSQMMETPSFDTTDSTPTNNPISLGNGGSFVNNGKFLVDGDLDSTDMGKDGKFILGGGTVEADTVRGDYYASGALAWGSPEVSRTDGKVIESTEYSNEYNTYQMFKSNNMYANIKSNSAMFDSKLTEKDTSDYYGIKMYRKSFYDILDNDNFAKYLEDNYKDEGKTDERTDLYKSYKLISTDESLNKVVKRTFGETIYPTLMEQNYKIAKINNNSIKNEVFNKSVDQEVGDFNYIGYAKYLNTENRKSDNFSENDMKYSSLSLGIDNKFSNTTRVGILGTVGKTDISFKDDASRKGDIYQINLFSIYENRDMKGTANLYTGKIKGDLSRKLSAPSLNEEMKGNTESNYYGLNLSFEKKYDFNALTLSPRLELNSMYMSEEKVKENGKYGLDVADTNGKSVESGIGFIAKKDIFLSNSYKVTPELSAMYYRELGTPYKDRDVKLKSVSNDSVKINKYDEGKDTGELNLGVALEKSGLGLKVGVNYEVNDQDGYITPYVNVGYTF